MSDCNRVSHVLHDGKKLTNHTEHDIHIYNGDDLVLVIEKTEPVYRVAERDHQCIPAYGDGQCSGVIIPVVSKEYYASSEGGLPKEIQDHGYIVSIVVATAETNRNRHDLYSPNTGPSGAVRKNGSLVGTKGLVSHGVSLSSHTQ